MQEDPAGCNQYYIINTTGVGITIGYTYTDCADDISKSTSGSIGPDGYILICSKDVYPVVTSNAEYTEITHEGTCTVPTPTPTPTPVPVPVPVAGGNCYSFTLAKATTSTGACGGSARTYYLDSPDGLFDANVVYSNSGCGAGSYQSAGYFADQVAGFWRYWDGTSFTNQGFCSM
jgi:hypothetical protein